MRAKVTNGQVQIVVKKSEPGVIAHEEAEILAAPSEEKAAETKLRKVLADLNLAIHDTDSWNRYEKQINAEANGWFDCGSTDISHLTRQ